MSLVTYIVDRMRVTRPNGKTAERNPERVYTVSGVFYSTMEDETGAIVRKDKLTIPSKNLDRDDVLAEGFAIDVRTGFLTLPEGKRGRTASMGLDEDTILAELAALRTPVPTEEAATETPKPKSK